MHLFVDEVQNLCVPMHHAQYPTSTVHHNKHISKLAKEKRNMDNAIILVVIRRTEMAI
jgi:hypothetical protein